jgi:hypothetical protein
MPQFSKRNARRIANATLRVEQMAGGDSTGLPGTGVTATAGQYTARITSGTPDGNGNYPAVITMYDSTVPGWVNFAAVKVKPANGETLTNGSRYTVRAAGTVGTDTLYVTALGAGGSGGGSITVQDSSGAPSYAGITTVQIVASNGLVLTNPAGGTARLDAAPASTTQTGVITTGTQTIAGRKTLYKYLTIGDSNGGASGGDVPAGVIISPNTTGYAYLSVGAGGTVYTNPNSATTALALTYNYGAGVSPQPGSGLILSGNNAGNGYATVVSWDNFGTIRSSAFAVADVFGYYTGKWGTDPAGNTVSGGIITTLGPPIPAGAISYSAGTPASWNGAAPTDVGTALDRCAALLKTLNAGVGP